MSDPVDLDALLAQAEEDRRAAYAAADDEYQRAVESIRLVKMMSERRSARPHAFDELQRLDDAHAAIAAVAASAAALEDDGAPNGQWPGLRAAIRMTINKRPDGFTLDDVMTDIAELHAPPTVRRVAVSGELWRMNRKGEVEIAERGSGNRPHLYRKGDKRNIRLELPPVAEVSLQ